MQVYLNRSSRALLALIAVLLVSCGYHTTRASGDDEAIAVAIPLIANDEEGILRKELAQQLAASGKYTYTSKANARYKLLVQMKGDRSENIGYMWDVNDKGARVERLYPSEGRRTLSLSVTLKDTDTNKALVGPFTVSGFTDYDYVNPTALKNIQFTDSQGQKKSVLEYSLGQLDSEEGAKNESSEPLLRSLAEKTVTALTRTSQ